MPLGTLSNALRAHIRMPDCGDCRASVEDSPGVQTPTETALDAVPLFASCHTIQNAPTREKQKYRA